MADTLRPLFVYTMTAGLGDFVVMGDLAHKVERLAPGARCLFVHRGNPHVGLWPGSERRERFFNIYSAGEIASLIERLRKARGDGFTVFGLQMAPGSLQGFLLHTLFKKMGLVHYVVDFNLINADIITPPRGDYILDLHLNQVSRLLQLEFPGTCYPLDLPFPLPGRVDGGERRVVGVHPWSRRGHLPSFVWPFEKWLTVIDTLIRDGAKVLLFGRDDSFPSFESRLKSALGSRSDRVEFRASRSVAELCCTIRDLDLLVSVNTSVIHIGYALKKSMVILSGPSLELWIPKHPNIRNLTDAVARFGGSDRWCDDAGFPSVARIESGAVIEAIRSLSLGEPGGN